MPVQLAIQEKCAKLVQKHFRDLRVISPQNCVKIVRAQLLHNFCAKNGARAQFLHNFSEPPATQAGWVLRTISAQFSQPGAIFLKSAAVQDRDVSNLWSFLKQFWFYWILGEVFLAKTSQIAEWIRGPKTHPQSRNTKKTPRPHELFRKVRANISLLSCDTSQEPNGNCSDKLVQMNFFILGGFSACDGCLLLIYIFG